MRRCTAAALMLTLCLTLSPSQAENIPWTQLSVSTCNVDQFLKAHPEINGKGIVIAVLDTGVDMGVAGLRETPDGQVKVVDAQDFSGQGDVEISRAKWNDDGDKLLRYDDDGKPEYYTPPAADMRPEGTTLWFGLLEESAYVNSAVADVNDNGEYDDVFGICVISKDKGTDDDAVCFVDTDGDRDFSDEKPLKNYKLNYDTFTFAREKKEEQIIPLTIAVNIFMDELKVVLHHDDGGHGTHVAGIAAGYRIMGQDGFNGVAPGAKVISMKLGSNTLAGGSTTTGSMQAAFNYAAEYARDNNVTVVCNLSFGIGSIVEGHHHIDKFVDRLLLKNPNLIICTSAGNEGPGLSSVGTPAGAPAVISVAALLARDTARDVPGLEIPRAVLTTFSSRGGELDKPDVATPGWMTSTVPVWNRRGDYWAGTSMASPYATGLCALLAQHVRDSHGVAPRADWVKRALKNTADPIPGFNALDYGAGIPDIMKAVASIDDIVAKHRDDPLYDFAIETESPFTSGGEGPAAYWRTTWFPKDREQAFTISPRFVPQDDMTSITGFSKRLTLKSDSDWCRPVQQQVYFRDTQSATVDVKYDGAKLTKPGLYVSTIEGSEDGEVMLRLVNTIIVPHQAKAEDNYVIKIEDQIVEGYKVRRHFVDVPAGAGAMHVTIKAPEEGDSFASINYINRPDGRQLARGRLRLDTMSDRREASYTVSEELEPGVYELAATSRPDKTSPYSLEIRFDGIHIEPKTLGDLTASPGSTPSGKATLLNVFTEPAHVTLSGKIEGYRKSETKELSPDDNTAELSVAFTSEIRAARIRIEVSDDDYAKFTDAPVNVYNSDGEAIAQDGLSETFVEMHVSNPNPGADSVGCTLEIQPAFSEAKSDDSAEFKVKIDYLYKEQIEIDARHGGSSSLTLYPGIPVKFSWSLDKMPPKAPNGTKTIGYIHAVERESGHEIARIDIVEEK